jgi:hypothetical protein
LSAPPLIAGCHGTKRYGQPDTEHAERADRDHVTHHRRSGLKWTRTGPSFVAQIDAVVHVYRSSGRAYAIGDWGGGAIAPAAALPTRRGDRLVIPPGPATIRPNEGLRRRPIASQAVRTIAGDAAKARKAQIDQRRANSWIQVSAWPGRSRDMTVLAMQCKRRHRQSFR